MSKAEEKKWEAEMDADTLARANEIKNDPKRLEAAQKAAKEKEDRVRKEAENLKRVYDEQKWNPQK